ncbi:MAG TPA: hypothetical protein VKT77_06995 [Chthonomonadaceae bacterium]|nr:hypothetical protein [Chthonomonadaceae bacterium]
MIRSLSAALTALGLLAAFATAASPARAQQPAAPFRAAAGKVDITPERPAYIAGYGQNRRSAGAHDRLCARCLVLESGRTRIAIVSCDLIGVPRYESERIRARVKSVPPEHLFIAATHTHSGPDTVGQWGPDLRTRGVDEAWMEELREKIAALVDETAGRLRPADLRFADDPDVPGISKNIRVPRILDTELGVMHVRSTGDGTCIATLVNFACHPEVLNTRQITADFPHWLYDTVEPALGGVCLYLNGAQGGMITADYDEASAPKGENWAAAEMLGKRLGDAVIRIARAAKPAAQTAITTQRSVFRVPLENRTFEALIKLKVFQGNTLVNGQVETEVNRITIGPAEFLTIPGEALPNVGFYLKRHMAGQPKFLLGLTCDFLGYILTPEDFGLKLYAYESSVSVGPKMEPLMVRSLLDMEPGASREARPRERAE